PPSQSDHVHCLGRPENPGVLTNRARVRRSAQNSQHWIHLQGPTLSSGGLGSNLSFARRVQFSQLSTINSQSCSASIHPPAPTLENEREYLNVSFAYVRSREADRRLQRRVNQDLSGCFFICLLYNKYRKLAHLRRSIFPVLFQARFTSHPPRRALWERDVSVSQPGHKCQHR